MDLGKVTRQLKDGIYKSKQDFAADIKLIVENCLLYNKHPENIFRSYAESLNEKATFLLHDVTDVKIRHRDTLSPDELKQWITSRSKSFLSKTSSPPAVTIPPLTMNVLPELYQIPIKPQEAADEFKS
eukprot:NODE_405_length_7994_cov_0.788600.p8 type:complete len:128 gc:universal NODE_405_length_7994_cov_0.788600:7287-6904(-)